MNKKWPKVRTNGFKLGMLSRLYQKKKAEYEALRREFVILNYLTR